MRRVRSVVVLMLGVLLWSVQPAYANFWDWLQEFSGPGPFHARKPNLMVDICPKPGSSPGFLRDFEEGSGSQPVVCYFADARFFQNDDQDNFGVQNVKVDIYEFGASSRVHRAISVGFGAGVMRISTPEHTAYKGVLTGPRVVIKPLLLYGSNTFWDAHRTLHLVLGTIKYYVKEDIALGHVRGKDFGLQPRQKNFNFDVQNDRVASTGFIIDVSDLLAAVAR